MKVVLSTLSFWLFLILQVSPATAGVLPLDAAYGVEGIASLHLQSDMDEFNYSRSFRINNDGSILIAEPQRDLADANGIVHHLKRIQSNGHPDEGFGQNGRIVLNHRGCLDDAERVSKVSMLTQNDGKILVASLDRNENGGCDTLVKRYFNNGQVDEGFRYFQRHLQSTSQVKLVGVSANGKIVLTRLGNKIYVLNADGSFDQAFGPVNQNGEVEGVPCVVGRRKIADISLQSIQGNEKILCVATENTQNGGGEAFVRILDFSGLQDPAFDAVFPGSHAQYSGERFMLTPHALVVKLANGTQKIWLTFRGNDPAGESSIAQFNLSGNLEATYYPEREYIRTFPNKPTCQAEGGYYPIFQGDDHVLLKCSNNSLYLKVEKEHALPDINFGDAGVVDLKAMHAGNEMALWFPQQSVLIGNERYLIGLDISQSTAVRINALIQQRILRHQIEPRPPLDNLQMNKMALSNQDAMPISNESVCSNRVVEKGEQCDDGNTTNGDGCSKDCKKEWFQIFKSWFR